MKKQYITPTTDIVAVELHGMIAYSLPSGGSEVDGGGDAEAPRRRRFDVSEDDGFDELAPDSLHQSY